MKKTRFLALFLCLALLFTSISIPADVFAAGKKQTTSITLNVKSKQTLYVGMSKKITVKSVKPKGSSKKVTYKSSDSSIVKVSKNGTMKALKPGTATITVVSVSNSNISQKVKVTVKNLVKNETYNKMVIALDKKKKTKNLSFVSKVKASNLTFSSSKKKVAEVSKKGVVKGKKVGKAKITIKGKNGSVKGGKQTITLYVAKKSVKSVALNIENATLNPTETITLKTTVTPKNAANVVTYQTSDESIAKVTQSGKVTAVAPGTATITAITVDGNKKATCTVTVNGDSSSNNQEQNPDGTLGQKPGDADVSQNTVVSGNTSGDTDADKPSDTDVNQPGDTETDQPGDTNTDQPGDTETDKPEDTDKPGDTETDQPGDTDTETPVDPENLTTQDLYEKVPYISTYYFNPTPTTDEEINIPIYVTDSEQTEYIDKDDSKRFDVLYEVDGEEHYLNNVKAGDMTISIGKLSAGVHYFAIQSIDKQTGLKSHKVYNDLTVLTPEESIISSDETYTVTDEDLAAYQINKNDSTDESDLETTRDGLTQLFKDLSEKGYQKCILPTGTYRINGENKRYECIMIPSNFTVDMNGSTFKLNTVLSDGVGCSIASMNDVENAHLTNGTLEGDRFERKELGLETGYVGEPINTFLFRGCKNCSITNLTIKNTTGHTVGTQYVWGPSQKITEYTKTRIVDGEEVPCDDCSTSNMIDLTQMKAWSNYVSVGQGEGYRGIKGNSGVIYVHFYDENQNYLETVTGYQFRKIRIPENAKYGRVTMLGTLTAADNVSFHCKHLGDYLEISDIDFVDTRTTAMAPSACNNLLIENCTYTRAGNSITPCAVDFEDGWQECQDVYYRNNKVLVSSGTATVIDNTGYNHVYEGIEGHRMIIRSGVLGGVIRNVQDETSTIAWTLGNKVVSKYSRLYNVRACDMRFFDGSTNMEEFRVRNCELVEANIACDPTVKVIFEDCVCTKLSGVNFVLKNCVVQPKAYWSGNTYCYNCEFKNLETPDGEVSLSFNKFDVERVFENCKFTGKTTLKNHNYFNSGTFKGCKFDDLSMDIGLGTKETSIGIDFIDCDIQSTAEKFIYFGPYTYTTGYLDLCFYNCNITHTGENLIYSMGRAIDDSIIEFDNCTVNKNSGKIITGYGNLAGATETSLDILFKGGSVNKELDTSWCGDANVIRIKYE